MRTVEIKPVFDHIERSKPRSILLVSQLLDQRIEYGDSKEIFTRKLRNREDSFVEQLTKMGIHHEPFVEKELESQARYLRKRSKFDIGVIAGELCYRSIGIAFVRIIMRSWTTVYVQYHSMRCVSTQSIRLARNLSITIIK